MFDRFGALIQNLRVILCQFNCILLPELQILIEDQILGLGTHPDDFIEIVPFDIFLFEHHADNIKVYLPIVDLDQLVDKKVNPRGIISFLQLQNILLQSGTCDVCNEDISKVILWYLR